MPASKTIAKGLGKAANRLVNDDGTLHPQAESAVTKLLSAQRPAVLAYIRSVRRRNPDAGPDEIIEILGKHYLNLVTGGGAAVGATAVVPGLGTTAAIGVAAAETAGFLEATALYAQAVAELHGLPVRDPMRSNALIMGLMLGSSGRSLVRGFAGQATGTGPALTASWGTMVVKQIPQQFMESLTKRMRKLMIKKFAGRTAGSLVGRILPFGVGAVVGAVVNRKMAHRVVENSADAFGDAPAHFEPETDPASSTPMKDVDIVSGMKNFWELSKRRRAQKKGEVVRDEEHGDAGEGDAPRTHTSKGSWAEHTIL